jgi:hypothetical protein
VEEVPISRALKPLNPDASWSALFGATVRRLRLDMRSGRPMTQAELGQQIGYSDATVGAIERAALRPDAAFMEGCERALPAAGMLGAMFPFVLAEWDIFERTGQRPLVDPLPPPEMLPDAANLTGPEDLVIVQEGDLVDVLELARQAEASDLGGGTLGVIDRTVDRFCRDYPTAAPAVLVRRVELRLHYLAKLLRGKVTLAQHRHLLVDSGWLATLLACLQFDLGDRDGAEASQAAAYTFAYEAEHQELLAWTHELLAWWALVDHRYDEVIEHARTGLMIAPHTSAGVQLAVQEARAGHGWVIEGGRTRRCVRRERCWHDCRVPSTRSTTSCSTRTSCRSTRPPATPGWVTASMPVSMPPRSSASAWRFLARCAGRCGSPRRAWTSAWSRRVRVGSMKRASWAARRWPPNGSPGRHWAGLPS